MYLYCLDCDVKVTIMWIKFEKNKIKKNKIIIIFACWKSLIVQDFFTIIRPSIYVINAKHSKADI